MVRKTTYAPIVGAEAFSKRSDEAGQSQAAILLSLASQLRGDDVKAAAVSQAAGVAEPFSATMASARDTSAGEFPIPRLGPAGRKILPLQAVAFAARASSAQPGRGRAKSPAASELAARLYDEPSHENAAALIQVSLGSNDELVRVAAANAALAVSTDPTEPLKILARALKSSDHLISKVAATTIGRYDPRHKGLDPLLLPSKRRRPERKPSRTSMLVHGTWARQNDWWMPGGDFHTYIKGVVWPDLYSAPDRYEWSGGYSNGARSLAATELEAWIAVHHLDGMSLMTHSHGGNIAMLASWAGVHFDKLVLLSCPVHPETYSLNFANVGRVVSIRVKLDLVLLADGSGLSFSDPRYNDHVLPVWFRHSASHDPAVWRKLNVPAML